MSGGFLSRFRIGRNAEASADAEPDASGTPLAHEATHAVEGQAGDVPSDSGNGFVDKVDGPDFDAEGNEVAIETLELSHEGLEIGEAADGVKYTMFVADGTPVKAETGETQDLTGQPPPDDGTEAIEKLELAYEKVEPASATDGAPEFQDALIMETALPAPGVTPDPPPEDLAQAGDGGDAAGWPVKWYVPEMDNDQASLSIDPDDKTTLVALTETKEMTGVISYLSPDQTAELLDDDGNSDSDPDDLL